MGGSLLGRDGHASLKREFPFGNDKNFFGGLLSSRGAPSREVWRHM